MSGRLPDPIRPMFATPGPPPATRDWAVEFKWDGIRAVVGIAGSEARLTSRNGNDLTSTYPELAGGLRAGRPLLLDGEIVAVDPSGRPDFGLLQQRMHVRNPSAQLTESVPVSLYLFDVLVDGDTSLLGESYDDRRARLAELGLHAPPLVSVSPSFTDMPGAQLLEVAREHGLEGIVAKRRSSRYEPGRRSPAWIKTALLRTQEVVIGGWTAGEGRRRATLGALLLGAYGPDGRLQYLGQVGTGFTEAMLRTTTEQLEPLRRRSSPFGEPVPREHARGARWVEPRLVGEVEYRTRTRDGRLRHAAWRGLRPDRDPAEVVLDAPPPTPEPARPEPARPGSAEALRRYRSMRDFTLTPEPAGGEPTSARPIFVVQRHRARRLHYDLRLQIGGVLASWAVPQGPTLDPAARQLAVHVEDHPMDYANFEGIIPAGQYGGGDVIVWDRGHWAPSGTDDPAAAVTRGELHFDLYGDKLRGRFVLVRRRSGAGGTDGKEQWLLVHKHDEHARDGWSPEDHPRSVLTGRTNDEVVAAPTAMWQGEAAPCHAEVPLGTGDPARQAAASPDELRALDGLRHKGTWAVGGQELVLTNLDKVLFPGRPGEQPVRKRELVAYYARIAPHLLPYLAGRPVNLHRYPDGVDRPGFWQKEVPGHAPDWLHRWHNLEADPGESRVYAVVDSTAALVWMANHGAVELHPWTSRLPDVHRPSWALIDIDPGPRNRFDDVLLLARLYRTALQHLQVEAAPKVTGKRGVQIWVPVTSGYTFADTRAWVERLSRAVGRTVPDLVSWEWHTDRRQGLARLDYTQNAINKTLVAPFSPRPAPGAPVSVPIGWDDLDDPDLRPDHWTVRDVLVRLERSGDPLRPLVGRDQSLPPL